MFIFSGWKYKCFVYSVSFGGIVWNGGFYKLVVVFFSFVFVINVIEYFFFIGCKEDFVFDVGVKLNFNKFNDRRFKEIFMNVFFIFFIIIFEDWVWEVVRYLLDFIYDFNSEVSESFLYVIEFDFKCIDFIYSVI